MIVLITFVRFTSLLVVLSCSLSLVFAQAPSKKNATLEEIINKFIGPYSLTPDNQFKLAAYAELKGRFSNNTQTLMLNFGKLGYMSFFPRNCLFRTTDNGVFHLNKYEVNSPTEGNLNESLTNMFEKIILLGNHGQDEEHIHFVDKHLAKKNIEPFDKIFLRHILVKYGKFDPIMQQVTFHTRDIPIHKSGNSTEDQLVKKYRTALSIKLEKGNLRGYYLEAGGTVYVEDVERKIIYATGEEYDYNVTAFKVFLQKLFVQSAQYIVQKEADRLEQMSEKESIVAQMVTYSSPIEQPNAFAVGNSRKVSSKKNNASRPAIAPLYHEYSWIGMMLAIMRSHEIDPGDPDVIKYFVHAEYFPRLYEQLTLEEKAKVDNYKSNHQIP